MYGPYNDKSILGDTVFWWLIIIYGAGYFVGSILLSLKSTSATSENKYGIENGHDKKYIIISGAMFIIGGIAAIFIATNDNKIYWHPGIDAWAYIICAAIAIFGLFMLPSMIARKNNHESTVAIVWLNYLFGATIIVYVILIIWASKKPASPVVINQTSSADDLKKFKELYDSGAITQEEYEAKKKQILGI